MWRDRALIADPAGDLLQYEEDATGFPKGFGFVQRHQVMTWDSVKIIDASHWLPVAADFVWSYSDASLYRVSIEYRNHRHFEAASTITYK